MASDPSKLLKQAALAYQKGEKDKARDLLLELVGIDDQNEKAWLLLSAVVDTLEDRQIALENVLEINPANEKARKGLELIQQKLAKSKPKEPLGGHGWSSMSMEATAPNTGLGEGWDAYAEEEAVPATPPPPPPPPVQEEKKKGKDKDKDKGKKEAPAFDFSGIDETGGKSAEAIPTSMDWGSSTSDSEWGTSAAPAEANDEYDSWIDNLNLKKDKEEPAASSGWGSDDSGWGSIDTTSLWGGGDTAESPPAASPPPASGWGDTPAISGSSWEDLTSDSPFGAANDSGGWGNFAAESTPSTPSFEEPAVSGWGDFAEASSDWGKVDEPSNAWDLGTSASATSTPAFSGFDEDNDDIPSIFADQPPATPTPTPTFTAPPQAAFGTGTNPFGMDDDDDYEDEYDDYAEDEPVAKASYASMYDESPPAKAPAAKTSSAKGGNTLNRDEYLRLIPSEIQAPPSAKAQMPLYAGIGVLALLNVGALIMLLSGL